MTLSEQEKDEPLSQLFRTMLVWKHMQAVSTSFGENIASIMAGSFTSELLKEGSTAPLWKASKKIARERVFPFYSTFGVDGSEGDS